MSAAVPTQVPDQLAAGESVTWKISLSDYPAGDGWALKYYFRKNDSGLKIEIPSTPSGNDHLVNLATTDTENWTAGDYNGRGFVSKASQRIKVWEGQRTIQPNYVTADDVDTRSKARQILDSIEAGILKISTAQNTSKGGGIVEWTAEGLHIKRSSPEALLAELTKQRTHWAGVVANETVSARLASGRASGRRILYRFGSPT